LIKREGNHKKEKMIENGERERERERERLDRLCTCAGQAAVRNRKEFEKHKYTHTSIFTSIH
jgi:hypothetical protein